MIKTDLYNNLSPEMLGKVRRGDKLIFKILKITKDPLNEGHLRMPSVTMIPTTDRVFDKSNNTYCDIACIRAVGAGGQLTYYDVNFTARSMGHMVLDTNTREGYEKAMYMVLSNYNLSNPDRDSGVQPLFELVDNKAKAKESRGNRKIRREALVAASKLTAAEVRTIIAAMGRDEKREMELLRDEIETFAEHNPEEFLKTSLSKDNEIKAVVKQATDEGIIQYNKQQSRYEWCSTTEAICTVPRANARKPQESFLMFVKEHKNGKAVFDEIESLLK